MGTTPLGKDVQGSLVEVVHLSPETIPHTTGVESVGTVRRNTLVFYVLTRSKLTGIP
jgi:hypothetical protein